MNFVGPFAENENNVQLFALNLIFSAACSETLKALGHMQEGNTRLQADGNEAALKLNKLDENFFIEIICATPIEKDA
jgi:hypothetical protein